jgi:hypothetical protein
MSNIQRIQLLTVLLQLLTVSLPIDHFLQLLTIWLQLLTVSLGGLGRYLLASPDNSVLIIRPRFNDKSSRNQMNK